MNVPKEEIYGKSTSQGT